MLPEALEPAYVLLLRSFIQFSFFSGVGFVSLRNDSGLLFLVQLDDQIKKLLVDSERYALQCVYCFCTSSKPFGLATQVVLVELVINIAKPGILHSPL